MAPNSTDEHHAYYESNPAKLLKAKQFNLLQWSSKSTDQNPIDPRFAGWNYNWWKKIKVDSLSTSWLFHVKHIVVARTDKITGTVSLSKYIHTWLYLTKA